MATPIPANTARFTVAEVAQATAGKCVRGSAELVVQGVTTDSRADAGGKLFVALEGEHFDGHRFAADAVRAGATALLVQRGAALDVGADAAVVEVDDTLVALGALARTHRR